MPRIFLSYRRDDSAYVANLLGEKLSSRFGRASVFLDVDGIPPGADFRKHLEGEVGRCDVLIALVGDRWLNATDATGSRRLDDPRDFVRIEIETALGRGVPVIPVLISGARMPTEAELPQALSAFAYRNALEIRAGRDLNHHVDEVLKAVSGIGSASSTVAATPIAPEQVPADPRPAKQGARIGGVGTWVREHRVTAWVIVAAVILGSIPLAVMSGVFGGGSPSTAGTGSAGTTATATATASDANKDWSTADMNWSVAHIHAPNENMNGPDPTKSPAIPKVPPAVAQAPIDATLQVKVWSDRKQGFPIDSAAAYPVVGGEQIHVNAALSREAFAYVLWIDGDGQITLLDRLQDPNVDLAGIGTRDLIHSPPELNRGWEVVGNAGTETIVLLAGDRPIDAAWLESIGKNAGPQPAIEATEYIVAGDDGKFRAQPNEKLRGPGESKLIDDAGLALLERLRERFSYVKAVRFPHTAP